MLFLIWTLSALMIMLPGLSYFLWQIDVLDRSLFVHHGEIPMFAYAVGNVGAFMFIVAAIWKMKCANTTNGKSFFLIGVVAIIGIGITAFIEMDRCIMEFVAG